MSLGPGVTIIEKESVELISLICKKVVANPKKINDAIPHT